MTSDVEAEIINNLKVSNKNKKILFSIYQSLNLNIF